MATKFITIGIKHGSLESEVIVGPEKPLHEHQRAYLDLLADFPVNENWKEVEIFQLASARNPLYFRTAKGHEEHLTNRSIAEKAAESSIADAKARSARLESENAEKERARHQAAIAKSNLINDQIRTANQTPKPKAVAAVAATADPFK